MQIETLNCRWKNKETAKTWKCKFRLTVTLKNSKNETKKEAKFQLKFSQKPLGGAALFSVEHFLLEQNADNGKTVKGRPPHSYQPTIERVRGALYAPSRFCLRHIRAQKRGVAGLAALLVWTGLFCAMVLSCIYIERYFIIKIKFFSNEPIKSKWIIKL